MTDRAWDVFEAVELSDSSNVKEKKLEERRGEEKKVKGLGKL